MPVSYRILMAKRVARDLEAIFEHIERDSPDNAAKMVARILESINRLKIFPHRTVVEDQDPRLKHPIRSLPVESYVIFFRVIEEHAVVRILRVLHGAQRRPKHF